MTVQDLRNILQGLPAQMQVFIKHFGDTELDENPEFEELAHMEIEAVDGMDAFTLAGY